MTEPIITSHRLENKKRASSENDDDRNGRKLGFEGFFLLLLPLDSIISEWNFWRFKVAKAASQAEFKLHERQTDNEKSEVHKMFN